MKDFVGNPIKIGDNVVIKKPNWDYFTNAIITKFSGHSWIEVVYDNSGQGNPLEKTSLSASNVVKIVKEQ